MRTKDISVGGRFGVIYTKIETLILCEEELYSAMQTIPTSIANYKVG